MKLLGLGDNVFDIYKNLHLSYPGGNAINVAVNASKLNVGSAYLGNFADDCYGYYMKAVLKSTDVDISNCFTVHNSSTKKCIEEIIDGERHFLKVDLGECWSGPITLSESNLLYINTFDAVLTSCNAKMEDEIYKLKNCKGIVSYDFGEKDKYRNKEYFNKICPYIDLAQFSMSNALIEDIKEMINKNSLTVPILITRGSKAPIFYTGDDFIEGVLNYIEPIDTMGAGDAYIVAFVSSLIREGWAKGKVLKKEWIRKSMKVAAEYAASVCLIPGGFGYPYREKKLKAVIFDMDGVIVDSESYWLGIFEGLLLEYEKKLSDTDKKELYGCSLERENEILSRYLDISYEEISRLKKNYSSKHSIYYKKYLMSGVKELISYLKSKNIKLVIASSSELDTINRMVNECGFNGVFDYIVSGEMFEESKPNPEIYNHSVELLGIPKENIFVIEDSEYGVKAATGAELDVLALRNPYYKFDLSEAMLKFNSHEDILEFMKRVIFKEE